MFFQTSIITIYTIVFVNSMDQVRDDERYCTQRYRRLCQGKGLHVGCQYPIPGRGEACENYTEVDFNAALRHFVTHYINKRRQKVATGQERVRGGVRLPRPEVMMFVDWGNELAYLAQRLADQCLFMHDECRATLRYPYAGQAVGEVRWRNAGYSDHLMVERAIRRVLDAWWGERRRVDPQQLTGPFKISGRGSVWGHFSQLTVWSLRAVGCGAVIHGSAHAKLLLVCDFSHTNMLGQSTLLAGPSLAACPPGTERRVKSAYSLLCAPVRKKPADPIDAAYDEKGGKGDYDAFTKDWEMDDDMTEDYDDVLDDTFHTTSRVGDRRRLNDMYEVKPVTKKYTSIRTELRQQTQKQPDQLAPTDLNNWKPPHRPHLEETTKYYRTYPKSEIYEEQIPSPHIIQILHPDHHDSMSHEYANRRPNNTHVHIPVNVDVGQDRMQVEYTVQVPDSRRRKYYVSRDRSSSYQIPHIDDPRDQTPNVDELREGILHVDSPMKVRFRDKGEPRRPVSEYITLPSERNIRRNWQQTRNRPPRPGAKALLCTTTRNFNTLTRKTSALVSLALDEDDIHQLFKDTGFSIKWRKSKPL